MSVSIAMAVEVTAMIGRKIKVGRYPTTVVADDAGLRFLMRNSKGAVREVRSTPQHEHCGCPDFAFRHEGNGTRCKHLLALAFLELIPALAPAERLRDLGPPDPPHTNEG